MDSASSLYTIATQGNLEPHVHQEWLLTNGLGGFASSSVVGCNTRRYHGLLIGATLPPVGRVMALNRMGEQLVIDDSANHTHEFSCNQFRTDFFPRGDRYMQTFEMDDAFAKWTYEIEGISVTKELQILWMKNVIGLRYRLTDPQQRAMRLSLSPFVSMRDFHGVRRAGNVRFDVSSGNRHVQVDDEKIATRIWADAGRFEESQDWWYGQVYAIETDRGLDDSEDLFTPGRFVIEGRGDVTVTLWVDLAGALDRRDPEALPGPLSPMPAYLWPDELTRRRTSIAAACALPENLAPALGRPPQACDQADSPLIRRLVHAANDFVVYRRDPDGSDGTSVIAGYPWFADWGRDTFISLPGLLLTSGRFAQALQVLSVFAQYVSEGMIPNRFDDYNNEPHYNTVDASLWFIHAAHLYKQLSGDEKTFTERLLPACRKIIEGYSQGTRFGIRVDPADGLVTQGDEHTQLTWMDAKCGGVAFTPRQGKPVEINALWYNALCLMGEPDRAKKVRDSFIQAFWISPFRGLADVIGMDGNKDTSIRPNQIFAASLPHSPLDRDQQRAVVEVVRRELLTPVGLRTLSCDNPRYQPHYTGNQPTRDAAYHNGAIWPWLIGGFLDAYLRVNDRSKAAIAQCREWLNPLVVHMQDTGCIGSISEIFEAQEPHRPVGCGAQAWSVAEVLRLAVELGM